MFARLSAAILLALPLLAVADSCNTGTEHCCNQAQDAKSANAVDILGTIVGAGVPGLIGQAGCMYTFLQYVLTDANLIWL
ncbi:hypothetical protein DXG01_009174 [Tephrocybe rancida]|nr:hypothetical protein DXG01_009174 [Tephrocybe rancida]